MCEKFYYLMCPPLSFDHRNISTDCNSDDMKMQIVEKVFPNNEPFRLERERYWINTLRTIDPHGQNKL